MTDPARSKMSMDPALNQAQREQAAKILLTSEGRALRVYLADSDIFDVTIVSVARVNDDGTVVGSVIWAISTTDPSAFDTGATLHFKAADVEKIEDLRSGACLFVRNNPEP